MPTVLFPSRRVAGALAALALATVGLGACSDSSADTGSSGSSDASSGESSGESVELRLGYFPNLTHAPGIVGIQKGFFDEALSGVNATVKAQEFNSGTDTIEAIVTDNLDITYIGPSPALTGYAADPEKVRIIAGATSGGAALVTTPEIGSVQDLKGKTIATPSLGNTQDVAARYYLSEQGFQTTAEGGGDVELLPQDNSVTVQTYEQGEIDGAWVPEPYASILEQAGGKVLLDEAELWDGGEFVTTHVLINATFLEENPDIVEAFLAGHVESIDYLNKNSDTARDEVADFLAEASGSALKPEVLASAWNRLTFTNDPFADTLAQNAEHAQAVELLPPIDDLTGIYELDPLNGVLEKAGQEPVSTS